MGSAIQSYISNASGSSASTISNVSSMSKYIQQQQQDNNEDDNVNDFIPMSSAKTKRRRMHRRGASEEVFSTKKDIPIIRRKIQLQNANGVNISFDDNDDDYDDYDNNENGSFYSNEVIPKPRASVCEKQTFIKFNANKAKQPKAKRIKDNKMRTTKKKKQQNVPNLIRASTLNPRMKKKHSFNNESSNDIYSNNRPSSHKKRGNMRTRYSFNTQESHTNSSNPTTQFSFDTDPDDNDDNDDYYDDESEDNEQEQTLDDIINKFWTAIDISANGCVQYEILKITLRVKGVHIAETNYDLMLNILTNFQPSKAITKKMFKDFIFDRKNSNGHTYRHSHIIHRLRQKLITGLLESDIPPKTFKKQRKSKSKSSRTKSTNYSHYDYDDDDEDEEDGNNNNNVRSQSIDDTNDDYLQSCASSSIQSHQN